MTISKMHFDAFKKCQRLTWVGGHREAQTKSLAKRQAHAHTLTNTHIHTITRMHKNTHALTHTHTGTHTHTNFTHSHAYTHKHTDIHTYTHIQTLTRTQAHRHIHTHTRTQSPTTTNTLTRAHSHIVCCISDVSPVVAYPYIPRHASVRNVRGAPVVAKRLESGAPPRTGRGSSAVSDPPAAPQASR
jgi:hypothetical protein